MASSAMVARFFAHVLVLAAALVAHPAQAGSGACCARTAGETFAPAHPSFDCKLARSPAERAICGDEELARLDQELNAAYLARVASLPPGRRVKFYTDELSWVRKRDLTCIMKDHFGLRRCLTEITIARIGEIAGYGK